MRQLGSGRARGARLCWQPGEERCALRLGSGAHPAAQGAGTAVDAESGDALPVIRTVRHVIPGKLH